MKSTVYLSLAFLLIFFNGLAQTATDLIDLDKVNYDLIENLFLKKLNAHRESLGIKALIADPILKKAAQDQAEFNTLKKSLSHRQPDKGKETAGDRIVFYKGKSERWGENVIKIMVRRINKKEPAKGKRKTYEETATQLFEDWKSSKGHYTNMIGKEYKKQGFAAVVTSNGELYGTQVFSE
jgi:uncharacterized protein YkwD